MGKKKAERRHTRRSAQSQDARTSGSRRRNMVPRFGDGAIPDALAGGG